MDRQDLPPIRVAYVEHGKPDVPSGMAGDPQGELRVQRVEESGESERCPVIGQIGIASRDNIISRESGQTSVWSFVTGELEQPFKEEKQMTVQQHGAGASSDRARHWPGINWAGCHREVRRLQARIGKATET